MSIASFVTEPPPCVTGVAPLGRMPLIDVFMTIICIQPVFSFVIRDRRAVDYA